MFTLLLPWFFTHCDRVFRNFSIFPIFPLPQYGRHFDFLSCNLCKTKTFSRDYSNNLAKKFLFSKIGNLFCAVYSTVLQYYYSYVDVSFKNSYSIWKIKLEIGNALEYFGLIEKNKMAIMLIFFLVLFFSVHLLGWINYCKRADASVFHFVFWLIKLIWMCSFVFHILFHQLLCNALKMLWCCLVILKKWSFNVNILYQSVFKPMQWLGGNWVCNIN